MDKNGGQVWMAFKALENLLLYMEWCNVFLAFWLDCRKVGKPAINTWDYCGSAWWSNACMISNPFGWAWLIFHNGQGIRMLHRTTLKGGGPSMVFCCSKTSSIAAWGTWATANFWIHLTWFIMDKDGKTIKKTDKSWYFSDGCKSNFSRLRDWGKENSVKPTRQKNIITAQFFLYYLDHWPKGFCMFICWQFCCSVAHKEVRIRVPTIDLTIFSSNLVQVSEW